MGYSLQQLLNGLPELDDAARSFLAQRSEPHLALGWALAPSPRVLLCDEPTSALDPELAAEVVDVLGKLANEGTTMVMATHDLRLASKIANNVVFLEAGNIVETGSSRSIFGAPAQERTKQFISTLNAGHSYDI